MLGRLMMHLYLYVYYTFIVVFNVVAFGLIIYYLPGILSTIISGGLSFAQQTN